MRVDVIALSRCGVYGWLRPDTYVHYHPLPARPVSRAGMAAVALLALLSAVAALQVDSCPSVTNGLSPCGNYTPQLGVNHCGELDQTVSSLESVFNGAERLGIPPAFFQAKGFLRVLAFVETRDGRNWTSCESGGIWNVDYLALDGCVQDYSDIQLILLSAPNPHPNPQPLSRSDYDCPANSVYGAVLVMLCNMRRSGGYSSAAAAAANLPTEPDSFPSFYARYYCHPDCNESEAEERFIAGMEEYLSTPCGPVVDSCSEEFDIIVLLDCSGSIGQEDFTDALAAVANLSSRYTIGSNHTQFGVILYSHIIHNSRDEDVIALDEYSDSANLTRAILYLPYPGGGTLTGSAITYATENGFNAAFGARESGRVPRVLIVATDGRSYDNVSEPARAAAADNGIILFSIGIGDGPDQQQLLDIAGGIRSRVFNTADYHHLIGLSPLLAAESCKAQVSVPPGKLIEYTLLMGEVKYFQISLPENCSQSLNVSFVSDSSSDSVLVYASFTIPNPNKRLYDFKWNVTATEPVTVTILPKDCTRRRRQVPSPDLGQPRQFFFSLELESSSNDFAEFVLNTGIIETPEDSQLSLSVEELQHSQNTLMYSCTATCSCPSATVVWEKGLSLPLAAKVAVSEDGRQMNITVNTTVAGHNGHYTCIIQSPGVIGTVQEIITVNLRCKNNGSNISPFLCNCPAGWTGLACDRATCSTPCQNGGSCISPDTCVCSQGWTGPDCSQPVCSFPCLNGGLCSAPERCNCTGAWEGQSCSTPVCSPVCANGGTCVAPQQCSCVHGWAGSSCDIPVCHPNCGNGGTCVGPNNCSCPPGWTGGTCSQATCTTPCQNGGSCVSPDSCVCSQGWTGPDCSQPVCSFPCLNGGLCSAPERCNCTTEWEGQSCSTPVCSPTCKNGGTCLSHPATCTCADGWRGTLCEEAICRITCENNGTCVRPDTCSCSSMWQGKDCTIPVCSPACNNGGTCVQPDHCHCTPEWAGSTCSNPVCTHTCENGGTCVAKDRCVCTAGWTGYNCSTAVCSPACNNGGTCVQPDHCHCAPEWAGSTCNESVCTPPCLNGGVCAASSGCLCPAGWTGRNCETAGSSGPAISQHVPVIVLVPLLLLLAAALAAGVVCLAVKYRRRGAVYRVEGASPRRTSALQEVGQTIRKKLSVISGNIPYTETVSGSESVENLHRITEENEEEEEEEGKL